MEASLLLVSYTVTSTSETVTCPFLKKSVSSVTTQDTRILIGQNILAHNTLGSYVIDNQNATVEFRRTLTSGYTVHTAPIIPASTSPHGPAYGALTIYNNNQSTTLDQKINWLKRSVGVSLPNRPNRDELEVTADLLIRYTDIIGTENGIKDTFIRAVRIPVHTPSIGLTSAGQIFSRCIAEAQATVASHHNIPSYIDDNLIQAKTFDEYILALEQLFIALRKFRLKLNPDKCTFLTLEAKFLKKQQGIQGHQRNEAPNIKERITKSHWPFSVDQTIPKDASTRTDQIRHILKSYEPHTWTYQSQQPFAWTERADKAFEKSRSNPLHHLSSLFWIFRGCSHSPLTLAMWPVELS